MTIQINLISDQPHEMSSSLRLTQRSSYFFRQIVLPVGQGNPEPPARSARPATWGHRIASRGHVLRSSREPHDLSPLHPPSCHTSPARSDQLQNGPTCLPLLVVAERCNSFRVFYGSARQSDWQAELSLACFSPSGLDHGPAREGQDSLGSAQGVGTATVH